eukprot:TRINITY_DN4563_c0_g2_i1.p1 TRINITY_DN4563_c0_g2~~TRINITY_DN4563_c0_g2_i1.p1  ORF type:complete len:634 (+),score=152.81 TRINITY_DN4563_c0_g2_i1:92-1993(+)
MGVHSAPELLSMGFALDDSLLRIAEDGAKHFVLGTVCRNSCATLSGPQQRQDAAVDSSGAASAATAPPAPAGASVVAPSPNRKNLPPAPTSPAPLPKSLQASPVKRELWANMVEETPDQPVEATRHAPSMPKAEKDGQEEHGWSANTAGAAAPSGASKHQQQQTWNARSTVPNGGSGGNAAQARPPRPAASPTAGASGAPSAGTASAATCASPSGRELCGLPKTWANVVSNEADMLRMANRYALQARRLASNSEQSGRRDTVLDYFLFLADQKGLGLSSSEAPAATEMPSELRRFEKKIETGFNNIGKAGYFRRGMKNEANNCYVNVVIQSLLPCNALMQLLSNCAANDNRTFYTGMVRLCKEFHLRGKDQEPCNVLLFPQVQEIISNWQSIGAQQDAGEFLFYMLDGMHEECKWKVPDASREASKDSASGEQGETDQVRSGANEDSPINRIFGGLLESSVRSRSATRDSVSLEPFNHLILDISSPNVDSVWTALEAYCGAEAVHEGRATRRLRFRALPKVLVVSLNRFSYNKDTGSPQKIKKAIKYEDRLTFERSWLVDGVEPVEYQLSAVICHHGESPNGGHYNAAVRYNGDWYMYDDAIVRQTDIREVLSHQYTAYLLLYQCHGKVYISP